MLDKEDEKKIFEEIQEEENRLLEEWEKAKEEVKDLIHPKYFDFIESHESYKSEGIVEIEETADRKSGYSEYKHCRIKDTSDVQLYMLHDGEIESLFGKESEYEGEKVEYWVYQQTGYLGDDYYGYLLLRLSNGKYWKVNYSC